MRERDFMKFNEMTKTEKHFQAIPRVAKFMNSLFTNLRSEFLYEVLMKKKSIPMNFQNEIKSFHETSFRRSWILI